MAATGRRVTREVPRGTRSWVDVGPDIERYLKDLQDSLDEGIPPGFNNTAPTTVNAGDAASAGTEVSGWAAANHEHGVSTGAPAAITLGTTASEGTSTALARADHIHDTTALQLADDDALYLALVM